MPGAWTLEADELTLELLDGEEVLATTDFSDLQDNRTVLVLDVYRVANAFMNGCFLAGGGECDSNDALTPDYLDEHMARYIRSALPFSEIELLYIPFQWNGARWGDPEQTIAKGSSKI